MVYSPRFEIWFPQQIASSSPLWKHFVGGPGFGWSKYESISLASLVSRHVHYFCEFGESIDFFARPKQVESSACYHCLVGENFDFPFIQHSIHGFRFAEIEATLGFPVSLMCTFTVPILSFGLGFTAGQSSYIAQSYGMCIPFKWILVRQIRRISGFPAFIGCSFTIPMPFCGYLGCFNGEQLLSFSSTTIFRSPSTSANILRDALVPFDFCCVVG